jgi:hypothetical protein
MGQSLTKQDLDVLVESISTVIQQAIQSNVQSSSFSASITQKQTIQIGDKADIECKEINIGGNLNINSDFKILTNFDTQTMNDIKSAISNLLDTENNQVLKIARQMFSSLFANYDDQINENIKNIVQNYVNNYTNQSNLQKASQSIIEYQEGIITFNGTVKGDICNIGFNQQIYNQLLADNIAKNMIQNFTNSQIDNQLKQKASQKVDKKETGLADALLAGAVMAVAIGIMYFLMNISQKPSTISKTTTSASGTTTTTSTGSKKNLWFTIIVIILILLFIYFLYNRSIFPFQPKQLWGPIFITYPGDSTQTMVGNSCQLYDNNEQNKDIAIYRSKQRCEDALNDPNNITFKKYFGCKYTNDDLDGCQQYPQLWNKINDKLAVQAVYPNEAECIQSNMCQPFYTCTYDEDGFPVVPVKCDKRNDVQNKGLFSQPFFSSNDDCVKSSSCITTFRCTNKETNYCEKTLNNVCEQKENCPNGLFWSTLEKCRNNCK